MTTQTQREKMKERVAEVGLFAAVFGGANRTYDCSRFGSLWLPMVGVVGIIKATAGYDRSITPILPVGGQNLWIDDILK